VKKLIAFLFLLFLSPALLVAQNSINMQTGGQEVCLNTDFYDSGGPALNYQPGENYIFTFCPDDERAVRLTYLSCELAEGDSLFVYDGPDVNANLLFVFTEETNFDEPEGFQEVVQVSDENVVGCITFEFVSQPDSPGEAGWFFRTFCQVRCQPILANFTGAPGFNIVDDTYINACPDEPITLTAEGIFPNNNQFYNQNDEACNFIWSFNNNNNISTVLGQNPTISFEEEGGIILGLRIVDQYGCESTNAIEKRIQVSPKPTFQGTFTSEEEICLTEQAFLQGVTVGDSGPSVPGEPLTHTHETEPLELGLAGETFLPDGNGVSYETSLFFDQFAPGATLQNAEQLLSVCLNMEHSYLGDLEIKLVCPNEQEVILKAFPGGGARVLGEPVFPDDANPVPGVGYDYCFSNEPTFALMITEPTTYTVAGVNGGLRQGIPEATYPENSYTSVQPLSNLEGCPLNGAWTIVVTDNLGADNGFIFSWGITLAQELLPIPFVFTANEVARGWLPHSINDPDIVEYDAFNETMLVQPTTAGEHEYIYRYINDFGKTGCVFDTTVVVNVKPKVDALIPENQTICEGQSATLELDVLEQNGSANIVWTNQNGGNVGSGASITVSPQDTMWYFISISDDCVLSFSDSVRVSVNPRPNTDFVADTTQGCTPFVPSFTNLTDPSLMESATWTFGSTTVNSTEEDLTHLFRHPGTYRVRLSVTSPEGCTRVVDRNNYIRVFDLPTADFTYNPSNPTTIDPQVFFNNFSVDNAFNTWNLGDLGNFDSEDLAFTFPSEGIFPVTLLVENTDGCIDSLTKFIRVEDVFTLYIPNSFSPNGDGRNDLFLAQGNDINLESFLMQVFDRGGQKIFETNDINEGWDGTINGGEEAPVGIYIYKVRAGREGGGFGDEQIGFINLIR
jgi:gliding motility-associated-like protein